MTEELVFTMVLRLLTELNHKYMKQNNNPNIIKVIKLKLRN